MKEPILDTPFRDSFSDFLETKEEIIWEGEPQLFPNLNKNEKLFFGFSKEKIRYFLGYSLLTLFILVVLFQLENQPILGLIFVILIITSLAVYNYIYKRPFEKFEYGLTQKKVIFKFVDMVSKKVIIYSLPLKDIAKVDVAMEKDLDDVGAIFFYLKNPNNKPFTTHNVRHGGKRYQITMELIEHPNEVVKLIREGIENENSSS